MFKLGKLKVVSIAEGVTPDGLIPDKIPVVSV